MKLVQCWIEHPVMRLDQPFTYLCQQPLEQGTRVLVDFNGRRLVGFVESVSDTDETPEQASRRLGVALKPVQAVLDQESLITPELHDLALWMAQETLSTVISCFQAMLPSKVKPQTSGQKIKLENWVKLSDREVSLTPRQLAAYTYLQQQGEITYAQLRREYPNQAHQLVEKGALTIFQKEAEDRPAPLAASSAPLPLTGDQQAVMDEIQRSSDAVYLLRGVTGSGKTEIYLQLAQKALQEHRQVLILVPEISLTPQMIERVRARFGNDLAIYHSALNAQEKYEQYRKVKNGRAAVIVGTRSAVFLPFAHLGLIVMDEEQDTSYKQENQPAYQCRDVAIWRGRFHGCKVILGSATPCLESYARALKGVYHLVSLKERINKSLPLTSIVALKDCLRQGQSYIVSPPLQQKIQDRLQKHQQVILLLNRRGYHSLLRCRSCQQPILCPHCDIAMSYHREEGMMKCHTCGTVMRVPKICPSCGQAAGWSSYGFGTEKLEQELQQLFPTARLLRMDADTTARKNSHARILQQFASGGADILLGTQMIAKGLDYPNVTLVGVINGDEGLNRTDFRSCEVTFDLLMQAGGRSGRANEEGEVVYQVFDPDHYAVQYAARQDYESFFAAEMKFRHAGQYPPYTYLIALSVVATEQRQVDETALWLKQNLHGSYKTIGVISLLKIQDRFRSRVLLKGKDLDQMRNDIRKLMAADNYRHARMIRIDVNPLTLD